MRRYFKNLLMALLGKNPFQVELYAVMEKYESAAEEVCTLQDMYNKLHEKMVVTEKWIVDYQTLIENLRERIKDKDDAMESLEKDYRGRIEQIKVAHHLSTTENLQ